jgi:thiamine-monophosphate kinase
MREFQLLEHIYNASRHMAGAVSIGPGDDMGAVRIGDATVLVTVDQVADGVHFDSHTASLARIGRKAMTRNLSDVAAMAAKPVGAVCAASLPRDFGQDRANELFDHMRAVAERYNCPLFGGDVSMWDHPLLLSVTVLAEPAGIAPVLRKGAKAGDILCVTGELGGSLEDVAGRVHHLDFEPRIDLARKLASDRATRPHCMLDLSDGLARDAGHLARAADLVAEIDVLRLPVSGAAKQRAHCTGQPDWRHAIGDGEDYELCFTIDALRATVVPRAIDGVPMTKVGTLRPRKSADESAVMLRLPDGSLQSAGDQGWEHHT